MNENDFQKEAIIEVCQLIFMRGLFEWDDILHNGLGCMVGCLVVSIFKKCELPVIFPPKEKRTKIKS